LKASRDTVPPMCCRSLARSSIKFLLLNPAVYFEEVGPLPVSWEMGHTHTHTHNTHTRTHAHTHTHTLPFTRACATWQVLREARCVVVAGGTMAPLEDFRDQLLTPGVASLQVCRPKGARGRVVASLSLLPGRVVPWCVMGADAFLQLRPCRGAQRAAATGNHLWPGRPRVSVHLWRARKAGGRLVASVTSGACLWRRFMPGTHRSLLTLAPCWRRCAAVCRGVWLCSFHPMITRTRSIRPGPPRGPLRSLRYGAPCVA
jgi:hypothetical protein